eukprot:PITA_31016
MELSVGGKPIGNKWVFKKKTNAEGKVEKFKARLVAKGYSQVPGIDFGDIFSPVAKVTSIRLLLSVSTTFDFEVEQMDVKTTFLHGDLEEEIYMKQPEGFAVKGKKELDSKLVKGAIPVALKLSVEQCHKTQEEEEDMSRIPYESAVGGLMYAMICTRPDIAHEMAVLSRFTSKLEKEHKTTVKQVFRYLHGISDYGLCYQGRPRLDRLLDTHGFVDVDWARDLDQRRSIDWAATHARKEAVWLQRLCSSMGLVQGAIRIDYDNQSAIILAKNLAYHSKTKHIDV